VLEIFADRYIERDYSKEEIEAVLREYDAAL
jgi:hypothetical protein